MKAIIIGYGKMGREIEKILAERGHAVVLVVDADNSAELNAANLARADVATTPAKARKTPGMIRSRTRTPFNITAKSIVSAGWT